MKIKKICVTNFKAFENVTFELNDQFTVFIGDNASGKTSVLDALAVASGSFFLGIDGVSSRTILKNEIRQITVDNQPRPQLPVSIKAHGNVAGETITWKREVTNKSITSKDAGNIKDIAKRILLKSRMKEGRTTELKDIFPLITYYNTCRLCAEHEKIDFQKQKEGILMAYTNSISEKSSSKEFLSWYKTQEDSVSKYNQELDIVHLNAFKEIILKLIPDNRWTDMSFDRKADEFAGTFIDNSGKLEKLGFSQLSDGFRNVIKLAADIAYRCIQLNPHLKERAVIDTTGIVLIDEIDLHLHPNWQKRIVGDLKRCFPNIQFIATTHSPFIIQSLKKQELIILDTKKDDYLVDNPFNYSIEDIAEYKMQVKDVSRSIEFKKRVDIVTEYYTLINQNKEGKLNSEIEELKSQLEKLEEKFSDDPTFIAHLRSERKLYNL